MKITSSCLARSLLILLLSSLTCITAHAGIKVLGAQYTEDQILPEFNCYLHMSSYPTSCSISLTGATVHVFIQNTNAGSILVTNATLAGYNLKTVIKRSGDLSSLWFYWDNPPQQILDAGDPAWFKADPTNLPPGAVGQMTVRLRFVPTNHVNLGVQTTGGSATTNITVAANAPRVTSIAYSTDRTKVYLHWWRPGGAAPTAVWVDGTNRTSVTTTVGDTNVDYAVSVISLTNALSHYSYHVYQGVYADGQTATASQRAWTNKFLYETYGSFPTTANYTAADWIDEAADHGFNNVQMNLGVVAGYMGSSGGRAHMDSRGYRYTILDKTKLQPAPFDPDMWFLNDEPDAEEENKGEINCGAGLKLPCAGAYYAGIEVNLEAVDFASELQALRPNVPTTVNLDGGLHPQSWYTWGPAVDVLQSNNYYEVRLRDAYWFAPDRVPLLRNAKFSYAIARTATIAASPNPFNHLLYSCKLLCDDPGCGSYQGQTWPYPFPESKRMEAYYSLAGGSKGMGYWWFDGGSPSFGLVDTPECAPLWKEMGLFGNEIKTARDLIVRNTPISMPVTPNSAYIWARAQASDTDTLLLYVVNDNYFNDITGCHYTNVANAVVTNTLPSWMVSTNTRAFEITTGGRPADASWTLNGNQFVVYLGTLKLTRLVVITKNTNLQSTIQSRFNSEVKTNLCNFAPEYCYNPPNVTLQPVATNLCAGGTANFKVSAVGSNSLAFQWQFNGVSLGNGGHYSGVTTTNLTVSTVDANDTGNYRCVVSCTGGTTNSSQVALTLKAATAITLQPTATNICSGANATLTIAATGEGAVTYQWQKNMTNISNGGHYSGCTTATLTVTGADANDAANYRCVATAGCGGSTSFQAALTVGTTITGQPSPQTVCAGANGTFGVTAAGGGTLTYQWRTNGVNLSNNSHYGGCTTANLTVTNVGSSDQVNYDCVVTGSCGSATSSAAALTLGTSPAITGQPSSQAVNSGDVAVFSITATGSNLSYQWQKNGVNVNNGGHYSGCTTATLTITGADTNDMASYRCVVNGCGSATSSSATLTVNTCNLGIVGLLNGNFEAQGTNGFGVATNWGSYSAGNGSATFNSEITIIHGGNNSQRGRNINGALGSLLGVRQTLSAEAGDAFTFSGWINPNSNPAVGHQVSLVAAWNGSTANPTTNANTTWKVSTGLKNVWTQVQNLSGVATTNSVTLFLDSRSIIGSIDITAYWDDVLAYHAYLPPAPAVSSAGSTSLNVDSLPGCNWNNTNAQFAITIGGGAYTLGTHWVQANGAVSTTNIWQTDATWATKVVTGLSTGTNYTLKVKTRYSGSVTQATSLSLGATAAPGALPPPTITQQPSAQNVCPGANATFNVAATGQGSLTYQWQTNNVNISNSSHYGGATSATLTVTNVTSADAVNYRCVVTDANGSTNSSPAALTLKAATSITGQPSAQNVCPGTTTGFSVSATGDGTLTYQWQTNSVNISNGSHYAGATSATLWVTNAGSADAVNYRCVVTGGCGSSNSSTAALTLKAITSITAQPSAQNVCPGANAAFNVSATGDGTLTYQWQTNGVNISNNSHYGGATAATLTVTNVGSADAVNYGCVVTGGCGSSNSSAAALTLKAATSITGQPSAQNICPGANATFSVSATGDGTLTYQWQTNGVNISSSSHYAGATSATLWVTNAGSADAVNYRCVVTGGCGSANSSDAALTLKAVTTITQQPVSCAVSAGGTTNFTVAATGDGTLTYQWQTNNVNVVNGGHFSGCTTATIAISGASASDAMNYRCVVTGGCGGATSSNATLTVCGVTLLNASFELSNVSGVATNWTGYQRSPNPTTVWTIQTASPPAGTGTNYQQIANTTSTGGGGVRQDIKNCVIGANYTVAGWFRGNSASFSTCTVKVSPTASTSWATATHLNPPQTFTGATWTNFSGTVVATGTNMTLWLDGQTGGTAQNKAECFDAVTVICTP